MSSNISSLVTSIVDNNYATLAVLTAVGYDYILTLSDEIEYVWSKPWGWITTLFVFVRYCGLCSVVILALVGSSFMPGPAKIRSAQEHNQGDILSIFGEWTLIIFISSADLVMILRLYVMYNASRIILAVLLTLYVLEIIPLVIAGIVHSARFALVVVRVLDFSACVPNTPSPILDEVRDIVQFVLASVMILLVATKFVRHSIQIYGLRNQRLELSRYLKLFAREGVYYFLAISLFELINTLILAARIPITGSQVIPVAILEYVPLFTLTPRFILSMRALYAHDTQGRDLDTQFGFVTAPRRTAQASAIRFAGLTEVQMSERDEVIQMDDRDAWTPV